MKIFSSIATILLFAMPALAYAQAGGQSEMTPSGTSSKMDTANTANNMAKMTSEIHRMMSDSYLRASEVFANGLDQLLSRDFPLTSKDVQTHVNYYIKGAVDNLKAARVHLTEFSSSFKRSPASQGDEGQKTSSSLTRTTQSVQQAIETADAIKSSTSKPQEAAQWKTHLQERVSELKDQIHAAMRGEKDLKQG